MRNVTVVILAWNAIEYTKKCLSSISMSTVDDNVKIIVVDNGSTDGTSEYIKAKHPEVELIKNLVNVGYTKANNQAINAVNTDVILLNNDIVIEDKEWLKKLQNTAYSEDDVGIVGCRIKRPGGKMQHVGAYILEETCWGQQEAGNEEDINQYSRDRDVESVVFACVYIKRSVINKIGHLDEDFFAYFEDTDFCLRAKRSGYKTVCCGSLTVLHHEHVSTDENKLNFNKLFQESREIFKNKWSTYFQEERYSNDIAWHSIVNFPSGYAISSKQFMLELERQGVRVSYQYVYGKGSVFPVDEPDLSDDYRINVIRAREIDKEQVQVLYGQGDVFERNFGKYKIGFTMLETTGIPSEWVRQANLMDEVWVPSSFNKETFINSGVNVPISIVPLGVDPNYFNTDIKGHKLLNDYTFLSIFEWGERKAPEILLKAFNEEFSYKENVILVCKVSNKDPSVDIKNQISTLNLSPKGGRIVISMNDYIPTYQLGSLYRSADCFVLSTRGEGWGMPILEAMACGLPTIATNWSSQTDFINENNSYPLAVESLVPAVAKCPYYEGFSWAEPSIEHLKKLMRYVFENKDEAKEKGLAASREILSMWTWEKSVDTIIRRLNSI